MTIAPSGELGVPPAAITKMQNLFTMRPAALFAPALGPAKANDGGKLPPVDRVEEPELALDRH
jgi:hypothetical protein